MPNVLVQDTALTAIAEAIRNKNGETTLYKPGEMADAITNLPSSGGGSVDLPKEALTITGNCQYRFAYDNWNWFIKDYGNKITTTNIKNVVYMFNESTKLENIPFEINIGDLVSNISLSYMFANCNNINTIPKINNCRPSGMNYIFFSCYKIEEFPEDMDTWFDWSYLDGMTYIYDGDMSSIFNYCYNLRKLPIKILKHGNPNAYSGYAIYNYMATNNYSLDEIVDLPNPHLNATWTNNTFISTFDNCYRLKNMTFDMPDGQPYIVNWKSQTIDLSKYVGYANAYTAPVGTCKVFTAENRIDDTTYQTLKDNPDAWAYEEKYSRYNHDSAVATLNSLPDASAYLATSGGTNTIKFLGASGSATTGGAISNLTEAEIAVAASKGWTVSIS